MNYNIALPFYRAATVYPHSEALIVGALRLDYRTLEQRVRALAAMLRPKLTHGRVGILASRSVEACVGILATAWAGGTYIPISLKLPEARLSELFDMLELDAVIVDPAGEKLLTSTAPAHLPDILLKPGAEAGMFRLAGDGAEAASAPCAGGPALVGADHLAYIEFTSGTTGKPKGVMVSAGAVVSYLSATATWYDFRPDDRAAETCDITFDLSVHNMLTTWGAGAALHVMRPLDMVAPGRFIRTHGITTWLSVPSVVALTRKAGGLAPGSLPSLRISLFCGEPLPVEAATEWVRAAPNSIVDNIYGPTEATIACLRQPWTRKGLVTPERRIVAIGAAYPGMEARIVDADARPVPDGEPGEIALSGRQLAAGYFRQEALTGQRFPVVDGKRWYLTGDRGYRDANGAFHHLGRLDNQIKIHGHRVELEEIDMKLREAAGVELAAAVAWPFKDGVAEGMVGFCASTRHGADDILARLRASLPPHMVPGRVEIMETMPLNANGKIDRRALLERLKAASALPEVA